MSWVGYVDSHRRVVANLVRGGPAIVATRAHSWRTVCRTPRLWRRCADTRPFEFPMDRVFHLPESVTPQGLSWVDEFGRFEPGDSMDRFDRPVPLMHDMVMARAEQDTVTDIGGSSCCPRDDVVCLAPGRRHRAVGKSATLVPRNESAPHMWREESLCASDVEDLASSPENERQDVGVTGQLSNASGADLLSEYGMAVVPQVAEKVPKVDGHHHLRTVTAGCWEAVTRQRNPAC